VTREITRASQAIQVRQQQIFNFKQTVLNAESFFFVLQVKDLRQRWHFHYDKMVFSES
jgi:hypothetical protein